MNDLVQKRFQKIELFCESLRGATAIFQDEWQASKFMIHEKMFALTGYDNQKRPILTLRQSPGQVSFLESTYDYILPGYYMNKLYWISILLESDIDDSFMFELIKSSYREVIHTLPKKYQSLYL